MEALILAGGFGTRIKSVLGGIPKPLAPVGKTNFINLLVSQIYNSGVKKFKFLLHYRSDDIMASIEKNFRSDIFDIDIDFIVEKEPLGTGGAVLNAINHFNLRGPLLILNADTWINGGVRQLLVAGTDSMLLCCKSQIDRYSGVKLDDAGWVCSLNENSSITSPSLCSAGMHYLDASFFKGRSVRECSIEDEISVQIKYENKKIYGVIADNDFIDIGVPNDYFRFLQMERDGRILI